MQDKTVIIVSLLVASLILSIAPAFAFYHPSTGTEDNLFENFGPRIDRILVKMYGTLDMEIAALQNGEIDITDWPLTKTQITTLSADPNIVVLAYGGEAGYYTLNFNNNNNQYLGNPPNPSAPNPVYQNPMSDIAFRRAVSSSIDNTYLCSVLAEGLYDPIYTPIPSYMAFWIHPDIRPGGALEALTWPYDGPAFVNTNAMLTANGFPINPGTGFRYWDRNDDNVEQADELVDLDTYTRMDILRASAGDMEAAGLAAMQIRYTRFPCDGATAYQICMVEQNYHSYTSGEINIGPDPDYLYDLYSFDNYFWDGSNGPANYAAIGKYNPSQNADLMTLKNAADVPTALTAARAFQEKFAADACEKPLASTSSPKAFSKYYTGGTDGVIVSPDDGENQYRGQQWDDIVDQRGFGENSWWSTLNMHPNGHELGDGTYLTVRYGWEETSMPVKINPIYSSWYWESEIWSRVIDSGCVRNPYTLGPVEVPQLLESWTQETWVDPVDGITKAAVTVTMRPDSKWNDGQPVTIDDLIYTLAILPDQLNSKGCSRPSWQPTLDQVAGYFRLDDYSAQILLRSNSFLATTWIVGNVILPKHFWQPFIAANNALTIMGDLGTGLIGSGPFLYTALTPGTSATMVRNPIYYLKDPVSIKMNFAATDGSVQISPNKIKPNADGFGTGEFTLTVTDTNEMKFHAVTYTMTVTRQKVGPGAPGAPVNIPCTSPVSIIAGGSNAQDFAQSLPWGEYEYVTTKTITSPAWLVGTVETKKERVKLTVTGDINGDWIVNGLDVGVVATDVGAVRGDPNSPPAPPYNPNADVTRDNKVNILDISQVALVFGWPYGHETPNEDVAITRITNSSSLLVQLGDQVSFNVTTENKGGLPELYDVSAFLSVYANTTFLGKQTVSLLPGQQTTLMFNWNTTDYFTGPYKVTAVAERILSDSNVTNNQRTLAVYQVSTATTHRLLILNEPANSALIPFTINSTGCVSDWQGGLDQGTYVITMPSLYVDNSVLYQFIEWEDHSTNPTRTINLISDQDLTAHFDVSASSLPIVYTSPIVASSRPSDNFTINVNVYNVAQLHNWGFRLYYDTRFMDVLSATEGSFLQSGGATTFQIFEMNDAYNSTHGTIQLACSLLDLPASVSGDGTLATIRFTSWAKGNSMLTLSNTQLNTPSGPIPHMPPLPGLGLIRVKMTADINNDGIIDIYDLAQIAVSFGLDKGTPPDPPRHYGYRPHADVAQDETIDIYDIVTIAVVFGVYESEY